MAVLSLSSFSAFRYILGIALFMGTCEWMNMETEEVGHTACATYTLPPTIGNSGDDGMEATPRVLLPVGEDLLALPPWC